MRKISTILLLFLMMASTLAGCAKEETPLNDYRPMVFIDGLLWGDTGVGVESLPDGFAETGRIEQTISQTEPFVHEEKTSNTLLPGTALFTSEDMKDKLYAAFVKENSDIVYLEYTVIDS